MKRRKFVSLGNPKTRLFGPEKPTFCLLFLTAISNGVNRPRALQAIQTFLYPPIRNPNSDSPYYPPWNIFETRKGDPKKLEMAGIGPLSQDWEPVVIRKKAPNAAAKKDEKAVNAARRAGAEIETIKKCDLSNFYQLSLCFSCIRSPNRCFLVFVLTFNSIYS